MLETSQQATSTLCLQASPWAALLKSVNAPKVAKTTKVQGKIQRT